MNKEKPLTEKQNFLMSLAAAESVRDWASGNTDYLAKRVLIKQLIRMGDAEHEELLEPIFTYFNTRFPTNSTSNGVFETDIGPYEGNMVHIQVKISKIEE